MKRVKWLWNRMKLMSFKEVMFHRLPQQFQLKIIGRLQAGKSFSGLKYNQKYKLPNYNDITNTNPIPSVSELVAFPIFDTVVDLRQVTNWRKDPLSGHVSPLKYYGKIRRQDYDVHGDVKYISELSRFSFLPFLALKSTQIKSGSLESRMDEMVRTWDAQNPYLSSIHWTSGIEVAIRAVNLVFTYLVLRAKGRMTTNILSLLEVVLAKHYHFLKRHPSRYSSANNHLTAELTGLLVISSAFCVNTKEKKRWVKEFYKQIELQINEDGVHMELSTRYHAEVLEHFQLSLRALKASGEVVPAQVMARVTKMGKFLEHCISDGAIATFGDDDEGAVLRPYFDDTRQYYTSLLKGLNYEFDTTYPSDGKVDVRNFLVFGKSFATSAQSKTSKDFIFEDSGYCFLYDTQHDLKLTFDTGTIGDPISAAHGHSDLLHFNLFLEGQPVIVDPGTFQYHEKHRFWRDYFRGITAHNCIAVDRRHHAVMNNRMSWRKQPSTVLETVHFGEAQSLCKASHSAYEDLGIVVTREVVLNRSEARIIITDLIQCKASGRHFIQAYLHFHPSVDLQRSTVTSWQIKTATGTLEMESELFADAVCIRGDDNTPIGWYSPSFGRKEKSSTLRTDLELTSSGTFKTIIAYR